MSKNLVSCLQELYTEPNNIAFFNDQEFITFEVLNKHSNNIATNLQGDGLSRKSIKIIGMLIERNIRTPIIILGILKFGSAFVALNKNDPIEQLVKKINILKILYVIYDELEDSKYEALIKNAVQPICLKDIMQESSTALKNVIVQEQDIATYVFTSGSTGEAKAVALSHQSLLNRFEWMWNTYPFTEQEVLCQKTSLTFVDYIWEIFGGMMKGIRTLVITDQEIRDLPYTIAQLILHNVSRITLIPSYLELLLNNDSFDGNNLKNLNLLICSGEELRLITAQKFQSRFPNTILLNLYGSSEVTADVTYYEFNKNVTTFTIPIGSPIHNNEIYIIKDNGQLADVEEIGEIYVYGKNIALGYHDPLLTARKFLPLKINNKILSPVFRTGDLGKFDSSNILHYCGRQDRQIKIRGIRIEPAEIEHYLMTKEEIKRAIVIKIEQLHLNLLVCFIEFNDMKILSLQEIRDFLLSKLPTYKVPDKFIFLDEFPKNSNAKVDYLSLNRIFLEKQTQVKNKYSLEQNALIGKVLNIWQRAFNNPNIIVEDNFYELGGTSLIAIQIVAYIKTELNIHNINIMDIYKYSSVEGLIEILEY